MFDNSTSKHLFWDRCISLVRRSLREKAIWPWVVNIHPSIKISNYALVIYYISLHIRQIYVENEKIVIIVPLRLRIRILWVEFGFFGSNSDPVIEKGRIWAEREHGWLHPMCQIDVFRVCQIFFSIVCHCNVLIICIYTMLDNKKKKKIGWLFKSIPR